MYMYTMCMQVCMHIYVCMHGCMHIYLSIYVAEHTKPRLEVLVVISPWCFCIDIQNTYPTLYCQILQTSILLQTVFCKFQICSKYNWDKWPNPVNIKMRIFLMIFQIIPKGVHCRVDLQNKCTCKHTSTKITATRLCNSKPKCTLMDYNCQSINEPQVNGGPLL